MDVSDEEYRRITGTRIVHGQLRPEARSDKDVIAVPLRVEDWIAIAENLAADMDAEDMGPAEGKLFEGSSQPGFVDPTDEQRKAAQAIDAEAACHDNYAATVRCIHVIEYYLAKLGYRVGE